MSFAQRRLIPSTASDLIGAVAPLLALTGGIGMTEDNRVEWMKAAGMALAHLPADLLRHGAKAAMRTADHPSKIVPTIIATTEDDYAARKRQVRDIAEHEALFGPEANNLPLPAPPAEPLTGRYRPPDPRPRNPTVADYLALGLSRDEAVAAVQSRSVFSGGDDVAGD